MLLKLKKPQRKTQGLKLTVALRLSEDCLLLFGSQAGADELTLIRSASGKGSLSQRTAFVLTDLQTTDTAVRNEKGGHAEKAGHGDTASG